MIKIDFSSKQAKLAIRFFTYGVMTFATAALTILAVFYAMGYRFNQSSLTFEQGGLVQFRSTPESATILVDNKLQNFKTPGRANLPAGNHTVEMRLLGYQTWSKDIPLLPGQLLWLNYIRFIPERVTTTSVKSFSSVSGVLASPDHRWLLLHQKGDGRVFDLVEIGDEKNPKFTTLTIPEAQLTKKDGKLGQFTILEWDLGSRYILVRHDNGDVHEFLRLDRSEANQAVNLSQVFRLNISDAHFAGNNPNTVFVRTDDVLRRLELGSNVASAALVTGLKQFSVYGGDNVISFVAERPVKPGDDTSRQQVVGLLEGDKETVVRTYAKDTPLKIAYAEYFRHAYLAINEGKDVVQVLRDPTTGTKDNVEFTRYSLGKDVQWLSFSNNGRMIVAGNGNTIGTYDLEVNTAYKRDLDFGAEIKAPLRWLDDYYLWSDAGEKLHIVEFDGLNAREITPLAPGLAVTISQNGRVLFSVAKNKNNDTFLLQASQLVIE